MLLMSFREAAARGTSHHSHSSITDGLAETVQRQQCSCRAAHECGAVERTGRRPTAAATRVDTVDTRNQLNHCRRVMRMSSCSSRVSADSRSTSSATGHQQYDHFFMFMLFLLRSSPSVQLHCRCRTSSVHVLQLHTNQQCSQLLLLMLLLRFSTTILHRAPHTHRTCARPLVR